ncbi:putative pentatricopeptide repeat-containing protein At1g17630 [Tripterygium wilfordii]|uniref:putative pentatricopeptide repeat-containing protein At1g17630 n=1 Tax=Tripterygium wilfordii TaxID=458696 RepID=UPI0018F7F575|nr:putative pentatricopeptide repeat-containing protein At1g17630 [Tripterygium wilfordii]XP_038719955.1 putative pentatricopeptide repeat-containing protein At1g17630 [Tripterygium wilfordii]
MPPPLHGQCGRRSPPPINLGHSNSIARHHHHQTRFISHQPSNTNHEILDFFDQLLPQCSSAHHCKQIHSQIVVTGAHRFGFLLARILPVYSRFGLIGYAQRVFNTSPIECLSNILLWNSILRANLSNGYYVEAINIYVRMREQGVLGDGFTLPMVIKAFGFMGRSDLCKIVHCQAFGMGFKDQVHVANELIGMYAKIEETRDARNVFERMSVKSHISWNMMVSCYAQNNDRDGAYEIFKRMEHEGLRPNTVTWTSLLSSHSRCRRHEETMELFNSMMRSGVNASGEVLAVVLSVCAGLGVFDKGRMIHGYVVKGGFENYLFVKNALISMYGNHSDVQGARNLFMEMETKNVESWNSLITSYAKSGFCDEAFQLFSQIEQSDHCPKLRPNVVSWSAIIKGFALKGQANESLEIFRQMQLANIKANSVTIAIVLSASAESAVLKLGREIHGYVIRALMDDNILVENGLINMYTKCGFLREGHLIFQNIDKKDILSWNSMITGYGTHGLGERALTIFDQMIKCGLKPDGVTFIAVLSACSHAGLVVEGRQLFDDMNSQYKIEPQMEHYSCMVDLLGRAGLLQEANEMVRNMPMEPNAYVLGALLNSYRMHENPEIVEETASHILGIDSESTGSYMLLSNIYAESGRWDESAKVRISARTKGLKKNPGQSWIEVKNKVYIFSAGMNMLSGLEGVYGVLEELALQMESEGYIHKNSNILQNDVGEDTELEQ